jgi:hypothetical protein
MNTNDSDILTIHHRWLQAEIAQDVEAMEILLHTEVICLLPGGTRMIGQRDLLEVLGRDKIRVREIIISNLWMRAEANLAVKVADFETHFVDGRIPPVHGTHTWCLEKERGDWKIRLLTWTMRSGHNDAPHT